MRTKASARYIAKVVDLTQQELPTTPGSSTSTQTTDGDRNTIGKHVKGVMNNASAKVQKVRVKKQQSVGKVPSVKRTKPTDGETVQTAPPPPLRIPVDLSNGLYRYDLTQAIKRKLMALQGEPRKLQGSNPNPAYYDHLQRLRQQRTTMMAHPGPSSVFGTNPWTTQWCSVPDCQRQAVTIPANTRSTSVSRVMENPVKRFSIFHNVELMAQSSCVSNLLQ